MRIKVLGSGCANCKTTTQRIEMALAERGLSAELEKVEDYPSIMRYGVMSTPAVVIDEVVVHSGSVPNKATIMAWLDGASAQNACTQTPSSGTSSCCDGVACC
jgi:small redox-active disulfide protein 2